MPVHPAAAHEGLQPFPVKARLRHETGIIPVRRAETGIFKVDELHALAAPQDVLQHEIPVAEPLFVPVHLTGEVVDLTTLLVGQQVDAALALVQLDLVEHRQGRIGAVLLLEALRQRDSVQPPHEPGHPLDGGCVQPLRRQHRIIFQKVRGLDAPGIKGAARRDVHAVQQAQHGRFQRAVDDLIRPPAGDAQHHPLAVQPDKICVVGQPLELLGHARLRTLVGQLVSREQPQRQHVVQAVDLALQQFRPRGIHRHAVKDADGGILPVIIGAAAGQLLPQQLGRLFRPVGHARHGIAVGGILLHRHHPILGIGDQLPLPATLRLLRDELRDPRPHQRRQRPPDVQIPVDDEAVPQPVRHQFQRRKIVRPVVPLGYDETDPVPLPQILETLPLVAHHQRDVVHPVGTELTDGALHQRITADGQQRLGFYIGKRTQTRPQTGAKDIGAQGFSPPGDSMTPHPRHHGDACRPILITDTVSPFVPNCSRQKTTRNILLYFKQLAHAAV